MKIPITIRVGGFTWKVTYDRNVMNEGNAWGSTHTATHTVFLEKHMEEQLEAETFLHECLHAAILSAGLDKANPAVFDDAQGETLVKPLSKVLFQVLRDNKLDFSDTTHKN